MVQPENRRNVDGLGIASRQSERISDSRTRPRLSRRQVRVRFIEELIYSGAIWTGMFSGGWNPEKTIHLTGAWIALSILTTVSSYAGQLVRLECKDMRFMWFSLHRKIPDWMLWLFWATVAAVLLSPLFALLSYLAVGLAFYRGFWFRHHCMGYRFIALPDILMRSAAGVLLVM